MNSRVFNVLFLSQRNSARSLLAEALLNNMGRGRFAAFSAGVRPAQAVESAVPELLAHAGIKNAPLRVKPVTEFQGEDAPPLDFVFTLSDTAAGEAPPTWPGRPITAHWRSEDPEKFSHEDPERRRSLMRTRAELERRLRVFLNLPLDSLDRMSLQQHMDSIGNGQPARDDDDEVRPLGG